MNQTVDYFCLFFFLIVGYLDRLPRNANLPQDSVKIVGSPNIPGINRLSVIVRKFYILNFVNLLPKTNVPYIVVSYGPSPSVEMDYKLFPQI